MAATTATVGTALVVREATLTWRIYDAWGNTVSKYSFNGAGFPVDDTTGNPTEWAVTEVGTNTIVTTDEDGGALLITTGGTENNGLSMQLGSAAGEMITPSTTNYFYAGIKFKINDADQTDFLFGLAVTDTALLGGVTDGIYFRSVDGSAALEFVYEKDSNESSNSAGTLVDDTYITCEIYWDGSKLYAYVDDVQIAAIDTSAPNIPDDELMRLSYEFLTGEGTANTCTVPMIRLIYIND